MYKSFIYNNGRLGINLNALLDEEREKNIVNKNIDKYSYL